MTLWTLVLATICGCYAFKLIGYVVPERVLARPAARRLIELLPVALLAALVVIEAIADGRHLDLEVPRLAGVGVGAIAVWRRAPFLLVVVAAAATAALLRLVVE